MKRLFVFVFACVLLLSSMLPVHSVQATESDPHPTSCQAGEVFIEGQSWWTPDSGHVHLGVCWPLFKTVSGTIPLVIHSMIFDTSPQYAPGKFDILQVSIPDSPRIGKEIVDQVRTNRSCSVTMCDYHDTLELDTTRFKYDGWHLVRIRIKYDDTDPLVAEQRMTLYLPLNVKNGRPVRNDTDPTLIRSQAWYTDADYLATRAFNLTEGQKSGSYSLKVQTDPDSAYSEILLNPAIHAGNRGTVLREFNGRLTSTPTIDTTTLPNGWNKIFIRGSRPFTRHGRLNEFSSVLVVYFNVQN